MKLLVLRVSRAILVAPALWTASASAQPTPAQPSAPSRTRWEVNWGDNSCMLIAHPSEERAQYMALRRVPGASELDLIVINPAWQDPEQRRVRDVEIVLGPAGQRATGKLWRDFRTAGGAAAAEITVDDDFIDNVSQASEIQIADRRRPPFQLRLAAAGAAIAGLRACERDALAEWGIDPAAAQPRVPPRHVAPQITRADYPPAALEARQQGTVVMRLTVETNGRVSSCGVVVSSGSAVLDEQSCLLYREQGRFRPALGPDMRAVRAIHVQRISWNLPDN